MNEKPSQRPSPAASAGTRSAYLLEMVGERSHLGRLRERWLGTRRGWMWRWSKARRWKQGLGPGCRKCLCAGCGTGCRRLPGPCQKLGLRGCRRSGSRRGTVARGDSLCRRWRGGYWTEHACPSERLDEGSDPKGPSRSSCLSLRLAAFRKIRCHRRETRFLEEG